MNPSPRTLITLIAINALVYLYVALIFPSAWDFRAYYFAGETARRAPEHLYDLEYQRTVQQEEFHDKSKFLPFFHPPHELLLFAPLSKLPFAVAFNLWRAFSILCLIISGLLLAHAVGAQPLTTILLISCVYAVPMSIVLGQDSLFLLLLISSCFYFVRNEYDFAAAAVLVLALFKPQIPVIIALSMLVSGRTKFFAWFTALGATLTGLSIWFIGRIGVQQLLAGEKLGELGLGIKNMPTARGLLSLVGGDHKWLSIALLVIAVLGFVPAWKRSRSLDFAFSSAVCLGCIFPFYLYAYDLVLLGIPIAILARTFHKRDTAAIAALTSAPLAQLVYFLHAASLLVLPTAVLGLMALRLRSSTEPTTTVCGLASGSHVQ